jgi:hypothetical protein
MIYPISELLSGLIIGTSILLALIAIRRLCFHKLRKFPGPKLAAFTSLYKTYYEVCKGGELLQHLVALHAKYGMWQQLVRGEGFGLTYSFIFRSCRKDRTQRSMPYIPPFYIMTHDPF